jgi:hypothetical protein
MTVEIKHKSTGYTLHIVDSENLSCANLSCADLSCADLSCADLSGADLTQVILCGTIGDMHEIKSMQSDTWPITWTADILQIGCQCHHITDWWQFGDNTINDMDDGALVWWKKWKPILQQLIAMGANNVED